MEQQQQQQQPRLRVGAVGIGGIWNAVHAPAWLKHPEAQVIAACDIVETKADKFATTHNIPFAFTNYRDLLKLKEVDVVDICTPNVLHSEIAVAALEAGKHVLCEKPDAISPTEAQRMADAATKSGKLLMSMRNNRFSPSGQFLKKYIAAGHMGEIYSGRCGWVRRRGIPGKGGWFTTKAQSGGGPLIDLGVHMIDLATWFMGSPKPVAVSGATYRKFAEGSETSDSIHSSFGEAKAGGTFDVEDLASGFVRFANGSSLQIEFSWASNVEEETIFVELRGTKGGCSLRNGQVKVFTEIEGTLCDLTPRLQGEGSFGQHARYIHHFVDCLRDRAQPTITPAEGVHMIQILSAIYQSAASGREVQLG